MCAASHYTASASLARNWEMQIHFKWRPKFAIYSQFCNPSPVAGWRLVATRGVARRAVNTNSLQLGHEETFSFAPPAFLLPSSQSALFRCKKFWPLQPLLANLPPDLQCLENCRAHNCRAGAPLQSLPWAAGLKSVRLIILRKPPTATSEARLLPWYPSEAFLCFPLPLPQPRHAPVHDDRLTPPRLSTRLWPGQTPVCRLVTTPQCSNVQCPHPGRGPLPCQWSSCGTMKRSVEVLLIFPNDPKAAIATEGFKLWLLVKALI